MSVAFRPPSEADIVTLAATMREADVKECLALGGDPEALLRASVERADWCFAAIGDDGAVLTIFGLGEGDSPLSARPWMLSAKGIERYAREVLTYAPQVIADMRGQTLSNVVHADNRQALRFLRWCGFEFVSDMKINGEPFIGFRMVA